MAKKKESEPAPVAGASTDTTIIEIRPSQIIVRDGWNIRQEKTSPETKEERAEVDKDFEHDSGQWPDDQLLASIKEVGLLEPPRVSARVDPKNPPPGVDIGKYTAEQIAEGLYPLVAGFRREKMWVVAFGDRPLKVTVMPSSGDPMEDDRRARLENGIENLQRKNVRPWEIAEWATTLSKECGVQAKNIADRSGLTRHYILNLIRLRTKLCPELWEAFRGNGEGIIASAKVNDLLEVCTAPHADQIELYNGIIREKKGGRPKGKSGRKARGGDGDDEVEEVEEEPELDLRAFKKVCAETLKKEIAKKDKQNGNVASFLSGAAWAFATAIKGDTSKSPKAALLEALRFEKDAVVAE